MVTRPGNWDAAGLVLRGKEGVARAGDPGCHGAAVGAGWGPGGTLTGSERVWSERRRERFGGIAGGSPAAQAASERHPAPGKAEFAPEAKQGRAEQVWGTPAQGWWV